jgi:hypothetical protein
MKRSNELWWVGDGIRFVCGAAAGGLIGFWALTSAWVNEPVIVVVTLILTTVLTGTLAVRWGRRFWEMLSRLRWFILP